MMEILWIILACGVGTFLLRWLPLRHARQMGLLTSETSAAGGWLAGVGPAAISALLTVSVWGLIAADLSPGALTRTAVALAVVVIVRRVRRGGVAMPTLCGALAYGLLAGL